MDHNEYCARCGNEIPEGTECSGITPGTVQAEMEGFCPDQHSPWETLCPDCTEAVNRFLADSAGKEAAVASLVARLPEILDEGALDELVHDAASQAASNANNAGREAQVAFLVEQWGEGTATAAIRAAAGLEEKVAQGLPPTN